MTGPHDRYSDSFPDPSQAPSGEQVVPSFRSSQEAQDFEASLLALEEAIRDLKNRYRQVQASQAQQQVINQNIQQLQRQLHRSPSPELKTELVSLQHQLDYLEVALESRLLSWVSVREVFWQALRFGGLGVILGWLLRTLVN